MPNLLTRVEAALSKPRPAAVHPDPEDVCLFCEGRGFVRNLATPFMPSPAAHPCLICDAVATMGTYLIEAVTPTWRYQFRFHSPALREAARRADHRAAKAVHSLFPIVAVQVLYAPLIDAPERVPTVVYSVPVNRVAGVA